MTAPRRRPRRAATRRSRSCRALRQPPRLGIRAQQGVEQLAMLQRRACLVGDHPRQHRDALDPADVDVARHDPDRLGRGDVSLRIDPVLGRDRVIPAKVALPFEEDLAGEEVAEQLTPGRDDRDRAIPQPVPAMEDRRPVGDRRRRHPAAIATEAAAARARGSRQVLAERHPVGDLAHVVAVVIEDHGRDVERDRKRVLDRLQIRLADQLDQRPRRQARRRRPRFRPRAVVVVWVLPRVSSAMNTGRGEKAPSAPSESRPRSRIRIHVASAPFPEKRVKPGSGRPPAPVQATDRSCGAGRARPRGPASGTPAPARSAEAPRSPARSSTRARRRRRIRAR